MKENVLRGNEDDGIKETKKMKLAQIEEKNLFPTNFVGKKKKGIKPLLI